MAEIRQLATLPDALRAVITAGTSRALCPSCGGGRSREMSLSVRQLAVVGLVKLSCFRASCGYYSTVVVDSSVTMPQTRLKQATPYTADTIPIGAGMGMFLEATFGLRDEIYMPHGWAMSANGHALVLPIRDPYGRVRGHLTRTFDNPKRVFTYKATAQPWLDWWAGDGTKPLVIVEDCLSACRLAGLGLGAVALLGTGINVEQAKEIAQVAKISHSHVYIALDRDAHTKSIKLAQHHAHILKMLPVCLDLDIKNMVCDDDIRALFGVQDNG